MKTRKIVGKIILYILSILILFVMLFPFFMIVLNSFKDNVSIIKDPLSFSGLVSGQNYANAFRMMNFQRAILNSIVVTIFSIAVIILFSATLAYYLVRHKTKLSKALFYIVISSMIIPFQTLMIPLVSIYGRLGILNSIPSLIIFYLGFGLGMATFMYHGFIKNSVPLELEEAATIDGCTEGRLFWTIVMPLLKPITSTLIILDLLWIWNDYLLPSLVLVKEKQRTLPLSTFYFFGTYSSEFGLAMAALVMSILPIIILYLVLQKQIIGGVVEGAIK
jgi:raffinose/stachyose/melibiose transport system permease protein